MNVCPFLNGRCKFCRCRGHKGTSSTECKENYENNYVVFEQYAIYGELTRHKMMIPALGFWPIRSEPEMACLQSIGSLWIDRQNKVREICEFLANLNHGLRTTFNMGYHMTDDIIDKIEENRKIRGSGKNVEHARQDLDEREETKVHDKLHESGLYHFQAKNSKKVKTGSDVRPTTSSFASVVKSSTATSSMARPSTSKSTSESEGWKKVERKKRDLHSRNAPIKWKGSQGSLEPPKKQKNEIIMIDSTVKGGKKITIHPKTGEVHVSHLDDFAMAITELRLQKSISQPKRSEFLMWQSRQLVLEKLYQFLSDRKTTINNRVILQLDDWAGKSGEEMLELVKPCT